MSRRTVELEAEAEDDRDKKTVGREGGREVLGRGWEGRWIIKGGKEKEKEKREGITIITHVK